MKNLNIPKDIEAHFTKNPAITVIGTQFEKYLSDKQSESKATDLNEFIFAYIPDLDLSIEIDRDQGLPDQAHWVHQCAVSNVGKSGENAVVYSAIVGGDVLPFSFNAIYLHDKLTQNSCSMIIHQPLETKQLGMTTTKSMIMQFDGAHESAHITVDAKTWQIDITKKIKEIIAEELDKRTPIGSVIISENPTNPANYGYPGVWIRGSGNHVLSSSEEDENLGEIIGENEVPVPLKFHTHEIVESDLVEVETEEEGDHLHESERNNPAKKWDLTRVNDPSDPDGQLVSLEKVNTSPAGKHKHKAKIPGHKHIVVGSGVEDATLDVQGRRRKVAIFKRVA